MMHVQRLWMLCLAYASATANPTFGNAQTIVSDMARKEQLLGGAWAFPSRNNHQNWGANPQALAAIQSTDGPIACWGRSEYGGKQSQRASAQHWRADSAAVAVASWRRRV